MSEERGRDEPVADQLPGGFGQGSQAVSEFVAARRLGLSVDTLRRDRRLGQLGIPFVKYGEGKRGAVRYDLADLERFVESRKKRAMPPVVETQAPTAPVAPMPVELEALVAEPGERIEPLMPRRAPPRTPWEAMAERYADEPEDDPFATGRARHCRACGGYFSG